VVDPSIYARFNVDPVELMDEDRCDLSALNISVNHFLLHFAKLSGTI
jgi:hypothetical protein